MKILMILENDFPKDDRVEKEALSLIQAGHQVDLLCCSLNTSGLIYDYKGIKIIKKQISNFIYRSSIGSLKFPFYFSYWEKIIDKLLKEADYQAIHLHDLPLAKPVHKLCKKYNKRFVLDMHENYPALLELSTHTKTFLGKLLFSGKQWQQYEKQYVSKADGLITVVSEMKDRVSPYANCNIVIVENTPPLNDITVCKINPNPNFTTLIYTGGIVYHRGLQTVIEGLHLALKKVKNIRLIIVGKGSYKPVLEKQVKELNLEKFVEFLGWNSSDEMLVNICKADIALIPHIKSIQSDNSSPNKLFHYISCGKPIMASNCTSIERVLNETQMGLTYNHNSPDDFKTKLLTLIAEKPFNQYQIRGRNALLNKYNWENSVKELIELYNNLY
jgi:glycosyltransferase involved in cell wall biosynthesis